MVASGDVLKVTDVQFNSLANVEFVNVYHYIIDELAPIPDWDIMFGELATKFRETVVEPIRSVQPGTVTHTTIKVENLFSPYEAFDYPINPASGGLSMANAAPSFVTLGFKMVRSSKTLRNGRKAIGGITEDWTYGDNGASIAGQTEIMAIRAGLNSALVVESDFSQDALYSPVLIRKLAIGTDQFIINRVSNVQYMRNGTQNSRKK